MEAWFLGILPLLLVVYAIALFLLPFFLWRIRNEMIAMNEKMSRLGRLLGEEKGALYRFGQGTTPQT